MQYVTFTEEWRFFQVKKWLSPYKIIMSQNVAPLYLFTRLDGAHGGADGWVATT
jgi:hypothetical protein